MNKRILSLVIPNIITNITVPLLGMVDLAIAGHIGDETFIGAIAIATMIFNMIYWNFGFLRMGTTGFTAQAYGTKNKDEEAKILFNALFIALSIAILLIILQLPILNFSFLLIPNNSHIKDLVSQYFLNEKENKFSYYALTKSDLSIYGAKKTFGYKKLLKDLNNETSKVLFIAGGDGLCCHKEILFSHGSFFDHFFSKIVISSPYFLRIRKLRYENLFR
mgnify:CR=1 FL=1